MVKPATFASNNRLSLSPINGQRDAEVWVTPAPSVLAADHSCCLDTTCHESDASELVGRCYDWVKAGTLLTKQHSMQASVGGVSCRMPRSPTWLSLRLVEFLQGVVRLLSWIIVGAVGFWACSPVTVLSPGPAAWHGWLTFITRVIALS